ncbi:hypothetical protein ACJRO7_014516 [Eucalyptus globulus]|uniref:Polygalacturonase n=1 Tax=Eucalyptus globulus TaxID=34317 RepID=A0ABD3L496_EUCGL
MVEEVHVRDCVFNSTENDAKIKTWEGGSGYVRGIHFENITIFYAYNPIIINQGYCNDQKRRCKCLTRSVIADGVVGSEVSNATYRKVRGTSGNEPLIALRCTGGRGCVNTMMGHINVDSSEPRKRSYADCKDVIDASFSSVGPPVFLPHFVELTIIANEVDQK